MIDLTDPPALPSPLDAPDMMKIAEQHPAVPLATIIAEIRRAYGAVPAGSLDRTGVITRLVNERLAGVAPG